MANEDLLSQEEIDSLLGTGQDSEPSREVSETLNGKTVRPFDPATQQRVVRQRLPTFDIVNERFARHLRMSLFNLIRRNPDISVAAISFQRYVDFTRNLPVPANINLITMRPLRGNALVVFPPNLVYLVVDSLFGGDGRFVTRSEGREFTHTEQRIVQRLLDLALTSYAEGWKDVYPVEPEYIRAEMQAKFTNIVNTSNELVVTARFHLEVGAFGSDFYICIPYATLEPILEILSGPLQKDDLEDQTLRARQLAGEIKKSDVELVVDFTSIKTTLGAVANIQEGDVFPIDMPQELTAKVRGTPVFKCEYGQFSNHKALRVTELIDNASQKYEE
jgi:flagellar motor switch protein FliM